MYASVHAFLDQIIDYAGLFPPAKLPLEEALQNYLHLKKNSPHRWMLGRFVCPAARLGELLPLAQSHADARLLSVSALGPQSSTVADFLGQLEKAIMAIKVFRRAWGHDEVTSTIEIQMPSHAEIDQAAHCVGFAAEHILQAGLSGFLETPMEATLRGNIARTMRDLDVVYEEEVQLGLKLRCGGTTANAFPTNEQVATFISQCGAIATYQPWKATAGLHHPRQHWDEALKVWHHGFLNVFGAGVLAWNHALSEADLVEILADRELRDLRFEEDRMIWKKWECTTAQIADARANFATSFGSCSFEEPCVDLVGLGLLAPAGAL